MSAFASAIIIGLIFGSLLQIGGVLCYDRQVGALRLVDMTIVKFMLSAIIIAMIGFQLLESFGIASFKLKPTILGANVAGGALFGIGWGLLGYCPGTAVGALGEGRWDALWGIIGMLVGAGVYAELFPLVQRSPLSWGDFGKITVASALDISPWVPIVIFSLLCLPLFRYFERRGL